MAINEKLYRHLCHHAKGLEQNERLILAWGFIKPRKRMPRNTSKLDFMVESLEQNKQVAVDLPPILASRAEKHRRRFLRLLKHQRGFRLELIQSWMQYGPIKCLIHEVEKRDPSGMLFDKLVAKIAQAVDMFKGKVSVLMQRLKKDISRLKSKTVVLIPFSELDFNDDCKNSDEYCYTHLCETTEEYIVGFYPSPEEILMAQGL